MCCASACKALAMILPIILSNVLTSSLRLGTKPNKAFPRLHRQTTSFPCLCFLQLRPPSFRLEQSYSGAVRWPQAFQKAQTRAFARCTTKLADCGFYFFHFYFTVPSDLPTFSIYYSTLKVSAVFKFYIAGNDRVRRPRQRSRQMGFARR